MILKFWEARQQRTPLALPGLKPLRFANSISSPTGKEGGGTPDPQSGCKGSTPKPKEQNLYGSGLCLPNHIPSRDEVELVLPLFLDLNSILDQGVTWKILKTPGPSRHWSWSRRQGRGCWGRSPRRPPPRSLQTAPRC